jgi:hypothetical protein
VKKKRRVSLTKDSSRRLPANEKLLCRISHNEDLSRFTLCVFGSNRVLCSYKDVRISLKTKSTRETASVKQGRPHKAVLNEPQNPAAGMRIPGT